MQDVDRPPAGVARQTFRWGDLHPGFGGTGKARRTAIVAGWAFFAASTSIAASLGSRSRWAGIHATPPTSAHSARRTLSSGNRRATLPARTIIASNSLPKKVRDDHWDGAIRPLDFAPIWSDIGPRMFTSVRTPRVYEYIVEQG
jgi:hypothetical protein